MRPDLERRLIEDLARLRREPPFSVDVTARVLAQVRQLGSPPRQAIASRRTLALAAAAVLLLRRARRARRHRPDPGWIGDAGQGPRRMRAVTEESFAHRRWVPGGGGAGRRVVCRLSDSIRGTGGALAPAVAAAMRRLWWND